MASIRRALIVLALTCAGLASAFAKTGADDAPLPAVTLDSCSWNRPGVNPFMGDVVAAVDRYTDIPVEVRARLKGRMARRQYDDIVAIRRDSIDGRAGNQYGSTIRDMHFGTHQLCRSVTRTAWTAGMQERGLVYCEGGQCILVPTVCRNVSRISRKAVDAEHAEAADEADPLAVVPPSAVPADAPATPLALDEAPSFARPAAWGGPLADGVVPGAGAPDDWGPGGGGPTGAPSFVGGAAPDVVASGLVPPGGSDGPLGAPPPFTPGGSPGAAPLVPTPVPEPQTWALMLAGLAALALACRRRNMLSERRPT